MSVSDLRSGRLVRGPGRKAVENRGERSLKRGPTDLDVLITSGRTGSRGRSSSGEGHCPVNIQCLAPLHHGNYLGIVPRTPMAEPEATPAELDEGVMDMDDQHAVAEAFERGCAQMRATLNRDQGKGHFCNGRRRGDEGKDRRHFLLLADVCAPLLGQLRAGAQ